MGADPNRTITTLFKHIFGQAGYIDVSKSGVTVEDFNFKNKGLYFASSIGVEVKRFSLSLGAMMNSRNEINKVNNFNTGYVDTIENNSGWFYLMLRLGFNF